MSNKRSSRVLQAGFTLIELIITIVVIGILAAVAIPKYQDITGAAGNAVAAGMAAAIASGSATNYALCAGGQAGCHAAVAKCSDAIALADTGNTVVTVSGTDATLNTTGTSTSCTFKTTSPTGTAAAVGVYGSP